MMRRPNVRAAGAALSLVIVFLLSLAPWGALADTAEDFLGWLRAAHSGRPEALFDRFTDEMKAAVPLPKLRGLADDLGAVEAVVSRSPLRVRFAKGTFDVVCTFDQGGRVAGLMYRPAAGQPSPARHAAYVTKTRLSLPFKGEWIVANGGRDRAKNVHAGNVQQNFAYDFTRPHAGDGNRLPDYEAYGSEVLAPADGTVAIVVDGVPDVPIGEQDPYNVPGNSVVIDHGNGEWSYLAHFRAGQIRVKAGQKVARGEVLGLLGNSGNTTEPHIHFHMTDAGMWHRGEAIPAPFADIVVDGKRVARIEPERGQRVANVVAAPRPPAPREPARPR